MKEKDFYSNLNLIKILIILIESKETKFDDIIQLDLIDKVNYLISKDNIIDETIYTEFVIEMFFELMYKINEAIDDKYSSNFDKEDYLKNFIPKIEKIAINFKLCIKLLGCENTSKKVLVVVVHIYTRKSMYMYNFYVNSFFKFKC